MRALSSENLKQDSPVNQGGPATAAEAASRETGFEFGKASKGNLEGVDPRLIQCAYFALTRFTTQDFMVFEGPRTIERQRKLVATGMSRTMNSKHLPQPPSNLSKAIDLVPIIGGIPKWDWHGCAKIAFAMDQAATQMGIADKIVWGGAWDRTLADFGGRLDSYMAEVEAYKKRHAGPDFIDGPHFQLND
jgi:peptidoglycan L-alanyl-D-glutamate endopeptidase CwlK